MPPKYNTSNINDPATSACKHDTDGQIINGFANYFSGILGILRLWIGHD